MHSRRGGGARTTTRGPTRRASSIARSSGGLGRGHNMRRVRAGARSSAAGGGSFRRIPVRSLPRGPALTRRERRRFTFMEEGASHSS